MKTILERIENRNISLKKWVFPIFMAVLWGTAYGLAMHSWPVGICLGVFWAAVFRKIFDDKSVE